MTTGIVYIARNEVATPANHYKIGKSDRADPTHRMRELNQETTNYRGEFRCLGYVLVEDVTECERIVHDALNFVRVSPRSEFFETNLEEIKKTIRETLSSKIIKDFLGENNNNLNLNILTPQRLLQGDPLLYKNEKHLLNYTKDIKNLSFFDLCKYAKVHNWHNKLCHDDACCRQFRHSFFILVYKDLILQRLLSDPNYIPDLDQTSLSSHSIKKEESLKLQKEVLKTDIKNFLKEIPHDLNLMYLGVIMFTIGEEIEKKNRLLTKHIIEGFKSLYPNNPEHGFNEKLDQIYYSSEYLTWQKLMILDESIRRHNEFNSRRYQRRF